MILNWKGETGMSHEAVVQQYAGHVSSYQKTEATTRKINHLRRIGSILSVSITDSTGITVQTSFCMKKMGQIS